MYPKLEARQMEALERLIFKSQDILTMTARQAIVWLLRKTDGLTKSVVLNISSQHPQNAQTIQDSVHSALSSGGCTHLNLILQAMGTTMRFSHHQGCFLDCATSRVDDRGSRIWISQTAYDRDAERLSFNPETIKDIFI